MRQKIVQTLKYLSCISVLFLSSCNSIDPEPSYKSDRIYPLAVGNYWEYTNEEFSDSKLVHSSVKNISVIDTITLTINEKSYRLFKVKDVDIVPEYGVSPNILCSLYNYESDGLYRYGHAVNQDTDFYFNRYALIKYPPALGDKWFINLGDVKEELTCISVNDTVEIEGKIYSCIVVRSGNGINWYDDFYYSKGIGLVQRISAAPKGRPAFKTVLRLKNYKINKDYYF